MSEQQNSLSPKMSFFFGIVTAVAVVSLAGFIFLLSKQNRGTVNTSDTTSGSDSGAPPAQDIAQAVSDFGKQVGLNTDALQTCFESKKYADKVNADANDAQRSGGGGTPFTIIVGREGPAMTVSGALPYEFFKAIVDTLLANGNAMEKVTPEFERYVTEAKDLAYKPVDDNDHIRGSVDAQVKFIEYSDFQCPFCKNHHPVMQQLVSTYSANDFSWTYRHLPLTNIHPLAQPLAEASECAAEIGGNDGFWAFADAVFQ